MPFELSFAVSFVTAGLVSFCVASVCETPLSILIRRVIQGEISRAFTRYVKYATYLVGISHGGTVNPLGFELAAQILESDFDRLEWIASILAPIMRTLTAIVSMYLALFILGLTAYTTVKGREKWHLK